MPVGETGGGDVIIFIRQRGQIAWIVKTVVPGVVSCPWGAKGSQDVVKL